jgi:hypothetical protein
MNASTSSRACATTTAATTTSPARARSTRLAAAARLSSILIDWILAAERNGWFGTPSRNQRKIVTRTAPEAIDRLHRMRELRGLHHTGKRYPGHGRKRAKYAYAGQPRTGPPDDPTAVADPDDGPDPVLA